MMPKLEDYIPIVGQAVIDDLRLIAEKLEGKRVQHINSTATGGGVAEILNRMVPLLQGLGIDTRWDVIKGGENFFDVTKKFHNALHGKNAEISAKDFEVFLETGEKNIQEVNTDADIVFVHDPQPIRLIKKKANNKWLWRCHVDVSNPDPQVWKFLMVTQISRFDYLKDPLGVVEAFGLVKKYIDCQLILAGGTAADDPEGIKVLEEVKEKARQVPDVHILLLPQNDIEVNALQRASTVIVQKSLKEGFGLTISEALWKAKPVVASNVGGIPLQIKHKYSGLLCHSVEGAAFAIKQLLNAPAFAERLGQNGREHVRTNFLLTRHLREYILLFLSLYHNEDVVYF